MKYVRFGYCCLLVLFSSSAFAAIVNTAVCTDGTKTYSCITSISGVEVQGDLYDVTVNAGTLSDLFPSPERWPQKTEQPDKWISSLN
jgi:hypothetical protein